MRTKMKSTTLWEENKMKILEDYKKIAHELLFEVDDDKMIKYKDKDGESKEMKAGSAKTMPKDHPAKQAWDKMQDGGDDSGAEKEKGQKIGGSDFDRDAQNKKVTGKYGGESSKSGKHWKELEGDDTLKHLSKKDLNLTMQFMKGLPSWFTYGKLNNLGADDKGDIYYYSTYHEPSFFKVSQVGDDTTLDDLRADIKKNVKLAIKGKLGRPTAFGKNDSPVGSDAPQEKELEIPSGNMKPNEDGEDDTAREIAVSLAKKYDISREYAMERASEEADSDKTYSEFAEDLEDEFQEMSAEGGQQTYDEPMFDTQGMEKMKYGESVEPKKKPFLKEQLERFGGGKY